MSKFFRVREIAIIMAISNMFALPLAAQDAGELRLSPTSSWQMKYNKDSCRLGRQFGEGENTTVFYIDRYEPGDRFLMVLSGQPLDGPNKAKIYIQFGPNEQEHEVSASRAMMGSDTPAVIVSAAQFAEPPSRKDADDKDGQNKDSSSAGKLDAFAFSIDSDREASISWLAIRGPADRDLILELGPMGEPMKAMQACVNELLTHWGIDVAAHRSLTRLAGPRTNPGSWMSARDYPTKMLQGNKNGLVQFRLTIGIDGRPSACSIQESTRPKDFDDVVCQRMIKKARFKPALDATGEPIISFWRSSVRFEAAD